MPEFIPILDLKEQYRQLKTDLDAAMQNVAAEGCYILGPQVRALEKSIAEYCECRFAVGVANGTDAIHLALRALEIGPGDEVITTPFTFIATTEAILMVGARPVFVDVDSATLNLDSEGVAAAITPRTKAIIPVHLYGQPCRMAPILELATRHNLRVVEDCAQAIGATYNGRKVGSIGDVGCLSFFPSKNLGCFGDGGMVVTNQAGIAERIEVLRRHGGRRKYHHTEVGLNSRLDEIQAAVLRVKLRQLENWTTARRRHAQRYQALLADLHGVQLPQEIPSVRAVYHQYTVCVSERDRVQEALLGSGVQTMVYYPVPLHLQEVHANLGYTAGDFPQAEAAAARCLSLPMFPELTVAQQDQVVQSLRDVIHQ